MAALSHLAAPGTIVTLRVIPNARSTGVDWRCDMIRIRVSVVPEKGNANAAVPAALSRALGVSTSRPTLLSGSAGRTRRVRID